MAAVVAQQSSVKCPMENSFGGTRDKLFATAELLAGRTCQATNSAQWGHLIALSDAAKNRQQGGNIPLYSSEHVLGRAQQGPFQYTSLAVSACHCTLSYTSNASGEVDVFLSDSSSNGTFLNLHRLEKNGAPIRVQHGDVISLVALPDAGQFPPTYTPTDFEACFTQWGPMIWAANAFAYVFVSHPSHKRKPASQVDADEMVGEATEGTWGTKIRRVGTGEQSLALSDFRSMQRANEELRARLAAKEQSFDQLVAQIEADQLQHAKALKEACEGAEIDLLARLRAAEERARESTTEAAARAAQLQSLQGEVQDLQQRLQVEAQSRVEREGVIERVNASLAEAQWEVEESRAERLREKEVAQAEKARAEALRAKLDEERQASCEAQQRERQLQTSLEEQRNAAAAAAEACAAAAAKVEEKEQQLQEAEDARLATECRWQAVESEAGKQAKVRQHEQEQLQGAREKVMLREAQLRAFHASASEIAALQLKQQTRMADLIRTLEDENEPEPNDDISGGSAPVEASAATRPLDVRANEEEVSSRAEGIAGAATQVVGTMVMMETQMLPGPTLPGGLESLPEGQEEGMPDGGQGEVRMSEQEEVEAGEIEGGSWDAPVVRESGEVVALEEGGSWAADTAVRSQESGGGQPLTAPTDSLLPTDGLNIAALLSAVHNEFGGSRKESGSSSDEEGSEE